MKKEILFDSSFLMSVAEHPTRWKEDIEREMGGFQGILLSCVKEELEGIASLPGKKGKMATTALNLSRGFEVLPSPGRSPDDELASTAQGRRAAVATADAELISTLKALGVQVVRLRSRRASMG